jgi:hypothetical protein
MRRSFGAALSIGVIASFILCGCGGSGGSLKEPWEARPWTPGAYDLLAAVTYRMDSETGTRTERAEHRGELIVAPDQTLAFSSTSGTCSPQTADEIERDRVRNRKTFHCQDAQYILEPLPGTVGGSAHISVQEGVRKRGPCEQWVESTSGQRTCQLYSWRVDFQVRRKEASLRVMKR